MRRRGIVSCAVLAMAMGALAAGCWHFGAASPAPPQLTRPGSEVVGVASWYGPGFDGRRTASGEIYNQEDLTAASMIFPLESRVMVTNLNNGRSVQLTINDRGPFKKGRKIDLSHKAAKILGMIPTGTAPVRIVLLGAPAAASPAGTTPQYFVQVGSFAQPSNADRLREQIAAYYPDVRIEQLDAGGRRYYRVRMGAFATRSGAQARASDSARFGLPMVIVSE